MAHWYAAGARARLLSAADSSLHSVGGALGVSVLDAPHRDARQLGSAAGLLKLSRAPCTAACGRLCRSCAAQRPLRTDPNAMCVLQCAQGAPGHHVAAARLAVACWGRWRQRALQSFAHTPCATIRVTLSHRMWQHVLLPAAYHCSPSSLSACRSGCYRRRRRRGFAAAMLPLCCLAACCRWRALSSTCSRNACQPATLPCLHSKVDAEGIWVIAFWQPPIQTGWVPLQKLDADPSAPARASWWLGSINPMTSRLLQAPT